ncbi:MAG: immunity protein 39 [Alphaproteobacteria bacterium]|nr:MAG: immunity protein 39 [Alphaproteobacteria bacterium]
MKNAFDRVIGFSAVDITPTKISFPIPMPGEVMDKLIRQSAVIPNDKFLWISVVYLFGESSGNVIFRKIDKKHGDLPISVGLNSAILSFLDKRNPILLQDIFMVAALEALIAVCKKYTLDDRAFVSERAKYGDIPETVEACQRIDRLLIS